MLQVHGETARSGQVTKNHNIPRNQITVTDEKKHIRRNSMPSLRVSIFQNQHTEEGERMRQREFTPYTNTHNTYTHTPSLICAYKLENRTETETNKHTLPCIQSQPFLNGHSQQVCPQRCGTSSSRSTRMLAIPKSQCWGEVVPTPPTGCYTKQMRE